MSQVMNNMMQTEHEFTLPMGYIDENGELHKHGTMRLATAADEILPLKDPRVQNNVSYTPIIVLSRVVTRLGHLEIVNTRVMENLFVADLAHLQDLYNRINYPTHHHGPQLTCPKCAHEFAGELSKMGKA